MNDVLLKMISVGFLVLAWIACDLLHINDPVLFAMLGTLISAVPIWHAATNLPFSIPAKAPASI